VIAGSVQRKNTCRSSGSWAMGKGDLRGGVALIVVDDQPVADADQGEAGEDGFEDETHWRSAGHIAASIATNQYGQRSPTATAP
jgi:hypothetical protein